jgi:parvulin-like peptidyl-prolyl isomerase
MKRIFTTFLLLILSLCPIPRLHAAELLDKIVAVINDDIVTQSELDQNLAPVFQDYRARYQGEAFIENMTKARAQILNQMVEDKLVLQAAKAKKIPVGEEEVNRKVGDIKKRFRGEGDFQRFLDSQGITLTKLRQKYQDMLLMQKIQGAEVRSRVVVSPLEAKRYYDEHPDQFTMPEAFQVLSITLRKSGDKDAGKTDSIRKKLEDLKKKIDSGALSFQNAAKQYSEDTHAEEGGDMGFISKGEFIPQLEEAIFKLKQEEVTDVLESEIGFHIFKLTEYRQKLTKTFEESKQQIENLVYSEKARQRFQEWVSELRKKAYISIR